jgi:hypothetical protein
MVFEKLQTQALELNEVDHFTSKESSSSVCADRAILALRRARERDELGVGDAESRHICLHSIENWLVFAPSPSQPRSGHLARGISGR